MGGKGGGRGPAPPDPRDVARGATGTNIATAIANFIGNTGAQTGPFGSTTREQTGSYTYTDPYTGESYDIPIFDTTTQLSEGEQGLYDQNLAMRGLFGQQAGTSDAVELGRAAPDVRKSLKAVELGRAVPGIKEDLARGAGVYNPEDNAVSRFLAERRGDRQGAAEEALRVSQSNRGVSGAGGDIADRETLRQQAQFTDERLADEATGLQAGLGVFGANEAARNTHFQRGLQSAALRDQLRSGAVQRGLSSALARDRLRSGGLNRQLARAHAAAPNIPGQPRGAPFFAPTTDVAGIINQGYNNQLNRYNAGQQGFNPLSGLFGVASLFL